MVSIDIPFVALLLQGIPELIAEVTLAFVIARLPLKWNKIIFIGVILAFVLYVVRLSDIPFGVHTILLIILLCLFLIKLGKGDLSLSLIASLVSFLATAIFEFISLALLMPIFGVTPDTLFAHLAIRIVIGEPSVILLFLTAFLLNKWNHKERHA